MLSFLFAFALAAQNATPAPAAMGWTFRESSDPAKPKSATAAIRVADGSRLLVRCDTVQVPIVSVQYMPKPPLAAGESRIVTLTLDEAQADMTTWQFPGNGAYNGEAGEVFLIADEIAKAKKVRVTLQDGDKMIDTSFEGPGDDTMFRKVYAVCGLPYGLPGAAGK
ncbi:hypothetical protein IAG41_06875 [Sphingomonas sp. JC676]|uniref:hypothetical protein n=1 Tax=Sphingomonas sp. JC676 TaxID=2768065 RepID=UPI00165771ED|nr:hypothetical protein [Sphingomonas sp. JC676]MBC9032111.1 hypothetical protein [Sphingomonas sp. JC676]